MADTGQFPEDILLDPGSAAGEFLAGVLEIVERETTPDGFRKAVRELLKRRPPRPRTLGLTAKDEANMLAAAAWEREDGVEAFTLAVEALRTWPDCPEAYLFLGANCGDPMLGLPLLTLAVLTAYEDLGQEAFERNAGHFWGAPETRPFMNALGYLARANRELGALEPAAMHFAEMLRLNPSDDQGARYDLLATYLEMGDHEGASQIFAMYPEGGAFFDYAKLLDTLQNRGDGDEAQLALRRAREANPHAVAYLTGARDLPEELPDEFEVGEEAEAIVLADLLAPSWASTEGAIDWLRRQTASAPGVRPAPSKEKRSGPRPV